jgi:hypothetical protein
MGFTQGAASGRQVAGCHGRHHQQRPGHHGHDWVERLDFEEKGLERDGEGEHTVEAYAPKQQRDHPERCRTVVC